MPQSAIPHLTSGNLEAESTTNKNAAQRGEGLLGGTLEPSGFAFSVTGGAVSGSIAILGSTFGGTTAERGSGIVCGRLSMPGSIREGGVLGF